jgi:hypothetical protein
VSRPTNPESSEARLAGDKDRLRTTALAYIRRCRENGATADEICAALEVGHNSIAPRVTELKSQGLITELCDRTGHRLRRKTRQGCAAGVMIAVEFARHNPRAGTVSLFGNHVPERRYPD